LVAVTPKPPSPVSVSANRACLITTLRRQRSAIAGGLCTDTAGALASPVVVSATSWRKRSGVAWAE